MRGFALSGIGPRDILTGDALGGNEYYDTSFELAFPLGLPKAFGVSAHTFLDTGTLTSVDDTGPNIVDSGAIRASIGAGLSWKSPFGPIRADVGFPIKKEPYDKTEVFRFNFGTKF